jgi:hypothetical protein
MNLHDDELQLRELLAPLTRVEPVALRHRKPSRRRVLIIGFLVAALLATGVAIAAGLDPFAGIGAADRAQGPRDVLDPAIVARIDSRALLPEAGRLRLDSSRFLGRLTGDRSLYLATTTKDQLTLIVTHHGELEVVAGLPPLPQRAPVTRGAMDRDGPGGRPPLSFGIAQDGISAVSFRAHGREQTVRVKHNVWFYEGRSNVLGSITIHYADGHTKTLTH